MPHAFDPTLLQKALAVLDVDKRLKANAAKLRYENRQQRLLRRQEQLKNQRAQHADPIARALAKAKALSIDDCN